VAGGDSISLPQNIPAMGRRDSISLPQNTPAMGRARQHLAAAEHTGHGPGATASRCRRTYRPWAGRDSVSLPQNTPGMVGQTGDRRKGTRLAREPASCG
jgi:hypothetical protein